MRIAFLASHNGTNMQAVLDACADGRLAATPCLLICNNPNANAINRAKAHNVPYRVLNSKTHPGQAEQDAAMLDILLGHEPDLILLAGYMKKIGPRVLEHYEGCMINIHPSLLPRHGGRGMYGLRVHEAVIAAGDTETGISIHLVDGEYDNGRVLAQRTIPVEPSDTAESLQARILTHEHDFLVDTIRRILDGDIVPG